MPLQSYKAGSYEGFSAFASIFEGLNGEARSHSYGTVVNSGQLSSVSSIWHQRLAKKLGMNSITNRSVAGHEAIDTLCTAVAGGSVLANGNAGVQLIDNITNDLFQDGGTVNGLLQWKAATRNLIWLALANLRGNETGISGPYTVANGRIEMASTGIWSAGGATETAAAEFSNGSAVYSDSNGAVATFTVDGNDVLLFLCGRKNGVSAINGGTARITVDGVVHGTDVPTGDVFRQSTFSGTKYRSPLCVPLLGIGSGSHTITVTNVGANGTRLGIDFWSRLSLRQPLICLYRQPYFAAGTYTLAATQAGIDLFNAALEEVAAEFSAYPVVVVPVDEGWDPETMMSDIQARHPNDLGSKHYVKKTIQAIKNQAVRLGLYNL